jgi:hypothetical protein
MIRTVNFTGKTGRFDVPSFLWTENENLTIKFDVKRYIQGIFVCVVKHGNAKREFKLEEDMTITLYPDWLKENGTAPLEILLELRTLDLSRVIVPSGRENGGYFIEPLLIEHVDATFTAVGWLTKIETEQAAQRAFLEELQSIVERVPEQIEEAKREAIVAATGGDVMNA